MSSMTLRQDIVETAARHLGREGGMLEVRNPDLAAWLEDSRAARGVAVARGLTLEAMLDQVERMDWPRLVSDVNREISAQRRLTSWGLRRWRDDQGC